MASRTISLDLIARNRASSVFNQVGRDAEKAAGAGALAFEKSTSRMSSALTKAGNLGASFGLPFASALTVVGSKLDSTAVKGKNFGSTLSKVGGLELVAAAAGIAVIGKASVSAAEEFQTAQTRLEVAIKNTGSTFADQKKGIEETDASLRKLGFTDTETESSLASLTAATRDTGKAQQLMGLATDIARAKHISLASATDLLVKVEGGRLRGLAAFGISTKDATGKTIDATEAFKRLTAVVGGQGVAYLSTFEGKMTAVRAEADHLEVTIGSALIPRIEQLASGAVSGVRGLQSFNEATGGVAGKVALGAAALPIFAFGMEKLVAASARAGAALDASIAGVGRAVTGNAALAASDGTVALSESEVAVATARKELALANLPNLQIAAATSAQALVLANSELAAALIAETTSEAAAFGETENLASARIAQAAAARTAAGAERELATATATSGAGGGAKVGLFAGLAALLPQIAAAVLITRSLGDNIHASSKETAAFARELSTLGESGTSTAALTDKLGNNFDKLASSIKRSQDIAGSFGEGLGNSILHGIGVVSTLDKAKKPIDDTTKALLQLNQTNPAAAIASFSNIKAALIADGLSAEEVDKAFKRLEQTIGGMSGPTDKLSQAQANLAKAQHQQAIDILNNAPKSTLDRDFRATADAAKVLAGAEGQVEAATNGAAGAMSAGGGAAAGAAFGYLSLAGAAKTAAEALANINNSAFAAFDTGLAQDKSKASLDTALSNLNNPQTSSGGGGGGGGGGQTATAAALDKTSKELAVRDAERGVESATRGVKDAEKGLTQARKDAKTAANDVKTAQQNLRTVLHGVAADSLAAKQATEAFTNAQDAAKSAALDLGDAQRGLQVAKVSQGLNKFGVIDAQRSLDQARTKLSEDQSAQADPSQIAQDLEDIQKNEIALKIARIEAGKKDEDVKRAEIALNEQRVTGKQKTRDLNEAQRVLNGTMRGYPQSTREAKDAQNALTEAQKNARDKTDAVATATVALRDANDQTKTAALGLQRAVADMNGTLTAAAGGGGGVGKMNSAIDTFKSRLSDAKSAAKDFAESVATNMLNTGHSIGASLSAEIQALKSITDSNPLLAGAFDAVLARLQGQLASALLKEGLHPVGNTATGVTGKTSSAHTGGGTFADGGAIRGHDPSGIPILAHPGEYVIRQKAVQKYGTHAMDMLNAGKLPKFATGGQVGRPSGTPLTYKPSRSGDVHYHVHLDHAVIYGVQDLNAQVVKALREETRKNGSIRGVSVTR